MDPLWECPDCHRRFAHRNQWHACSELTLDEHLADKSALSTAIYRAVATAVGECGDFRIHPQKSRVAFIARMTFAGLRLAKRWADLSFITPDLVDSPRIRRIDLYGPTSFGHDVRLDSPAAVDGEVADWLCRAHRRGVQETRDPHASVEPVMGPPLERLHIPLRSTVIAIETGRALRLPSYAAQALAEHRAVRARIGGHDHAAVVVPSAAGGELHLEGATLEELGLGEGDEADVFIRPAF